MVIAKFDNVTASIAKHSITISLHKKHRENDFMTIVTAPACFQSI